MKTSHAIATFFIWAGLLTQVYGCGITVVNRCPYMVTTCAQADRGPGQVKGKLNQYNVQSGQSQFLDFGKACIWTNGAIWPSVRGQCENPPGSNQANDWDITNFAEFNIGAGGLDYYDINNVAAYTLPVKITPTKPSVTPSGRLCGSPQCTISNQNLPSFCKANNRLLQFPSSAYVCQNTDGLAGKGPTDGTRIFKKACPDAYSYKSDYDTSVYSCPTGINYEVTFCPYGALTDARIEEKISSM